MNKIWSFLMIVLLSIIGFCIFNNVVNNSVIFNIIGEKEYTLSVNSEYSDLGVISLIFDKNVYDMVEVDSNLDTSKVGTYYIKYNLNVLFNEYNLTRTINVIDEDIPIIKLNGKSEFSLYVGDIYEEEGASAIDNYDGDLTSNIVVEGVVDTSKVGTYEIKYSIVDSSGNINYVIRKVNVREKKVVKPVINNNCVKYYDNYNNDDAIIRYIKDNNYKVSIGYYNLITENGYFYRTNSIYYGASLLKTLDAIYIYDNNLVNERTKGLIEKAITISDNDSHYYLYNYIGLDNLKNYGIGLGACNTLSGSDNYGNTTVSDQMVYLKKLYELTNKYSDLKSYFINENDNYLKFNDIDVIHKYGRWGTYYHDVGIVLDEEPYIIIVLTQHAGSLEREIVNNISKLIFEYHNSNK